MVCISTTYTPAGGSTPAAQAVQRLQQALAQITNVPSSDLMASAASAQLNQPQVEAQAQQDLTQQSGIPKLQGGQQDLSKIFQMYLADSNLSRQHANTNNNNPYASPVLAAGMSGNGQMGGEVNSAPNPYLNATPDQIVASTQPSAGGLITPSQNTNAMMAVPNSVSSLLDTLQSAIGGQQDLVKSKMGDVSKNYQARMGVLQSLIDAATKKEGATAKTAFNSNGDLVNMDTGEIIKSYGGQGGDYASKTKQIALGQIDELMKDTSNVTVGFGSLLKGVPSSPAKNFAAKVESLKANIAFGALAEMRAASKSGGALGQVSNIEEQMLTNSLGAIADLAQSPDAYKAELGKIKNILSDWEQAKAGGTTQTTTTTKTKFKILEIK